MTLNNSVIHKALSSGIGTDMKVQQILYVKIATENYTNLTQNL